MPPRSVRPLAAVVAAVAFLVFAPRASAEVIHLTLTDGGTAVTYKPYGVAATTVGAGPFHWTQQAPLNANFGTAVTSYCIDLDHFISTGGSYTYTVQSDLKLAPTIGNDPAKIAALTEYFDRYYNTSLTSAANAAAFQLGLWELVYDWALGSSLATGRIQGTNALTQSMLSGLGTPYSNHDLAGYHLTALLSPSGNQDQLTVVANAQGPVPVPGPPAAILALAGAGCLLARRLRRARAESRQGEDPVG